MKSMRGVSRYAAAFVLLLYLAILTSSGYAQTPTPEFEYLNGHVVRGAFLAQYRSVADPLRLYGYPITGEFQMLTEHGWGTVQYFQRARFDLVLEPNGVERVKVANLGSLLYAGPGPLAPVPTDPLA